ncbi:MAG: FliM/FliN family flagellar motor switch protein [Candidatus Hydrogenedentes bacterium]|jgi:flagellar motor switch protein FliN/FliY|nr:FliM/FliN family flagellar motor switch protein [Candidatus Hydrogenedentota bacterium]
MAEVRQPETQDHDFQEVVAKEVSAPGHHLTTEDLHKVKLTVTADLGSSVISVRDILELKKGSVVSLNKMAGEMTDILMNGIPFAKGEVVVIGDALHIRIVEISGAGDLVDERPPEA